MDCRSVWRYVRRNFHATERTYRFGGQRRFGPARSRRREFIPVDAATETPLTLVAHECVLLVVGCQPEVLDTVETVDTVLLKTNAAIDIARRHGVQIKFVRMAFDDIDYQMIPSTNREISDIGRLGRFRNGSSGASLHISLAVDSADTVIRTTRLGAFSTTDLDEHLTNAGITTLLIAGVDTSGAVLTTIREAADRDYRLVVLSDCCFDSDQASHDMLMSSVYPRQAEMATVAGIYRAFSAESADRHVASRRDHETQSL